MTPLRISIIVGSTRPQRFSEKPAQWIFEQAQKLDDVEAALLDLRDFPLPFFDQPVSPSMRKDEGYGSEVADAWAEKIRESDAFIIVSPEYNHGTSAVLKNALDTVYKEWNQKAVAFVSYGSVGGARAVEQLRLTAIELQMAPIRNAVHIPAEKVFPVQAGEAEWNPEDDQTLTKHAEGMLKQLLWWAKALRAARNAV